MSQINPSRHNWCIRVRVARMWTVSGTSKGRSFSGMELVLVDEEVRHFTYASDIFSLVVAMRFSIFGASGHRHYSFHWAKRHEQICQTSGGRSLLYDKKISS